MVFIVVPLPFRHELLFYFFCQTFEKLFIVCAKIFINLKVKLSGIEPKAFYDLKLKQSRHIRLFHNIEKTLFIIFYNHYLPKISK
jgi:hypothetical protein